MCSSVWPWARHPPAFAADSEEGRKQGRTAPVMADAPGVRLGASVSLRRRVRLCGEAETAQVVARRAIFIAVGHGDLSRHASAVLHARVLADTRIGADDG